MKFFETFLQGAFIVEPEPFKDDRGFFARVFCKNEFNKIGHTGEFLQINHSMNEAKGTLRGLHYQLPPYAETNLLDAFPEKYLM